MFNLPPNPIVSAPHAPARGPTGNLLPGLVGSIGRAGPKHGHRKNKSESNQQPGGLLGSLPPVLPDLGLGGGFGIWDNPENAERDDMLRHNEAKNKKRYAKDAKDKKGREDKEKKDRKASEKSEKKQKKENEKNEKAGLPIKPGAVAKSAQKQTVNKLRAALCGAVCLPCLVICCPCCIDCCFPESDPTEALGPVTGMIPGGLPSGIPLDNVTGALPGPAKGAVGKVPVGKIPVVGARTM